MEIKLLKEKEETLPNITKSLKTKIKFKEIFYGVEDNSHKIIAYFRNRQNAVDYINSIKKYLEYVEEHPTYITSLANLDYKIIELFFQD